MSAVNVLQVMRDDFVDASITRAHDDNAQQKAMRSEGAHAAVERLLTAIEAFDIPAGPMTPRLRELRSAYDQCKGYSA